MCLEDTHCMSFCVGTLDLRCNIFVVVFYIHLCGNVVIMYIHISTNGFNRTFFICCIWKRLIPETLNCNCLFSFFTYFTVSV